MPSSLSATMHQRSRTKCDAWSPTSSFFFLGAGDGSNNNYSKDKGSADGANCYSKLFEKGSTPCRNSFLPYFRYCTFFVVFVSGFVIHSGSFDQFHVRSKQIAQAALTSSPSPPSVSSWSNPLSSEMKDGCWQWEGPSVSSDNSQAKLKNNSNVPLSHQLTTPPKGLVVTMLLGHGVSNFICDFYAGQVKHFFLQQRGIDVLFLLPSSDSDQLPSTSQPPTMDQVLECLHLKGQQPVAIKTWNNLDGTNMTTHEYTYDFMLQPATTTTTNTTKSNRTSFRNNDQQQPVSQKTETQEKNKTFSVFLAYTTVRLPRYVKEKYDLKNLTREDGRLRMKNRCHAPAEYIQGTRWYVNELLHLGILKEYEYFLKVDTDISFRKPFPIHLLHDMKLRGAVFAHTASYVPGDAGCGERSTDMLKEFRRHYIRQKYFQEQYRMRKHLIMDSFDEIGVSKDHLSFDWIYRSSWKGQICSANHSTMHLPTDLYYSNFVIGRTDFFQRPEVLALGQFVSEWPHGFFEYRWGDQIFWHFALGYFIGPDYEQAVADYSEFRCAPVKNCWESIDDKKRFPTWDTECDNEGSFRHEKDDIFQSDWSTVDNWNASETQDELMRQSSPYTTTYDQHCPDDY